VRTVRLVSRATMSTVAAIDIAACPSVANATDRE
jgi:hypothetical protein